MAEQQCMQCFAKTREKLSGGCRVQFLAPKQGKRKTKFVSKPVFRFPNTWKTVGPLINLQSVQHLLFKMFFIFEKRKTEFDTDFRFFRARKTNGPLIHALISCTFSSIQCHPIGNFNIYIMSEIHL